MTNAINTQHTPGKLIPCEYSRGTYLCILGEKTKEIAWLDSVRCEPGDPQANAEYLARCWNTHDKLVAVLESLIEFWDNGTPVHPGAEVVQDARAALAKAKGE